MTMNGNIKLVKAIQTAFDMEELKTLCFQVGVDYDDLTGEGNRAKARELVEWCERHGKTEMLTLACFSERPNLFWGDAIADVSPAVVQHMLPKMSERSTGRLMGWQMAQLTARINHADVDRARIKALMAANLALTGYQVLSTIFK